MAVFNKAVEECDKLTLGSSFRLARQPEELCVPQCCIDNNLILSPYDILRLKNHLGITSTEFLERFTRRENEEKSNLPLVILDLTKNQGRCPLVEDESRRCTVYSDRPASCRLYPLGQGGVLIDKAVENYYFFRQDKDCPDSQADTETTVECWREEQGIDLYESLSRDWEAMILWMGLKTEIKTPAQVQALFYMAAYDLDKFRRFVFETSFLEIFQITGPLVDLLRTDDVELLKLAYGYLKTVLLMESKLCVSEEVIRAANPTDASNRGYTTF
jgi:uncharacterized protein